MAGGDGDRARAPKRHKSSVPSKAALVDESAEMNYADDFDDDARDVDKEVKKRDFTKLELKPDHANRPLWACADGRIFLETFSLLYKQAPESMHEYNLTPHSLYAAVSVGLETTTIISVLSKLSKTKLPREIIDFIHGSTANYGKVKLVLKKNRYFVESPFPEVLKTLLKDEVISRARTSPEGSLGAPSFSVSKTAGEIASGHEDLLNGMELAAATEDKETHSFEIDPSQVENVKQRCLPNALNFPMLEEYDFRNDTESTIAVTLRVTLLSNKPLSNQRKKVTPIGITSARRAVAGSTLSLAVRLVAPWVRASQLALLS